MQKMATIFSLTNKLAVVVEKKQRTRLILL